MGRAGPPPSCRPHPAPIALGSHPAGAGGPAAAPTRGQSFVGWEFSGAEPYVENLDVVADEVLHHPARLVVLAIRLEERGPEDDGQVVRVHLVVPREALHPAGHPTMIPAPGRPPGPPSGTRCSAWGTARPQILIHLLLGMKRRRDEGSPAPHTPPQNPTDAPRGVGDPQRTERGG